MKKFKYMLLVGSCLYVKLGYVAEAMQFDLEDIDILSYAKNYNKLPSVEENNDILQRSPHFKNFLETAEDIVKLYDLETMIGFRLIHSHFPVEEGQIMTEEYQSIDNFPSLVTYAQELKVAQQKGAVPSSWIFTSSNDSYVFEASTDPAVKAGVKKLQNEPEFMEIMSSLLEENKLQSLLSIAFLKKDTLSAQDGEFYVELNTEENRSIVNRWKENDFKKQFGSNDTIQTAWSFAGPKMQPHCYRRAIQICVPTLVKHFKIRSATHETRRKEEKN